MVCIRRFLINTERDTGSVPVEVDPLEKELLDKSDDPIELNPLDSSREDFFFPSDRTVKCLGHFESSSISNISSDFNHSECHRPSSLANSDEDPPLALDPIALMNRRPTLSTSFWIAWRREDNHNFWLVMVSRGWRE